MPLFFKNLEFNVFCVWGAQSVADALEIPAKVQTRTVAHCVCTMRYCVRLFVRGNLLRLQYFDAIDVAIDWAHTSNDWDEIRVTTRNVNSKMLSITRLG